MADFKHNLGKLVPECQTVLGFVSAPLNQFYMLWRHRNHRRIIIIIVASRDDGGGIGIWNCQTCANHLHRVQITSGSFFYSPDPLPAV